MTETAGDGALGRQVLLLRQELTALREHVMQLPSTASLRDMVGALVDLDKRVSHLGERLDGVEAEAEREAKAKVWDWTVLGADPEGADFQEAWAQLTDWVDGVLGGLYSLVAWEDPKDRIASASGQLARPIPPCWPQHFDLIAELGWLCQEWMQIYRTSKGTPAKAGDWHDRYLVGLRKRIASSTAATCRTSHLDQPEEETARRY